MRENHGSNESIERQIRELQKEIAELSSLLAFKKFESEHPRFEKLAEELAHVRAAVRRKADRMEEFGREHLCDIGLGKSMAVLGGIFLIGSVGYAVLLALGIIGSHRR